MPTAATDLILAGALRLDVEPESQVAAEQHGGDDAVVELRPLLAWAADAPHTTPGAVAAIGGVGLMSVEHQRRQTVAGRLQGLNMRTFSA